MITTLKSTHIRSEITLNDRIKIDAILKSTGLFHSYEIDVALELVDTYLNNGEQSGYYFLVADIDEEPVGFAIYGPTPCTRSSWDLYWIAVSKSLQGKGTGSLLLKKAEEYMLQKKAGQCWIETSSQESYEATCHFYTKHGYHQYARLPKYYDENDDLIIFGKDLQFKK